jgi:hypothetical protein
LNFLDFILCNDEINMLLKMGKKRWIKGGEMKNQICKWWKKGGK